MHWRRHGEAPGISILAHSHNLSRVSWAGGGMVALHDRVASIRSNLSPENSAISADSGSITNQVISCYFVEIGTDAVDAVNATNTKRQLSPEHQNGHTYDAPQVFRS